MRYPGIPDVRDGLTHEERVVLYVSPEDLSAMLARLGARK